MELERTHIVGVPLSDDDLADSGAAATKIVTLVKEGNKKAQAIKVWTKMN